MSAPTRHRRHARPTAPQQPSGERPGLFDAHAWLVPACAIATVLVLFSAMILLTWAGSGGTLFR